MLPRLVTVALLYLLAAGAARPAARIPSVVDAAIQEITTAELHRHVAVLASDAFAGRGVGHSGNREAEQYLAGALRDARIPPASPDYLQQVDVYQPRLGAGARLRITSDDAPPLADFQAGPDFYPLPESGDGVATGRLVFGGHGVSAPTLRHDDYASIDARGAIVLVLEDAPDAIRLEHSLSSEQRSELGSIDRKVADARAHGAAGLIVVQPYMTDPKVLWPETTSVRSASYRLLAPMRAAPLPVAALSERAAAPVRQALEAHRAVRAELAPGVDATPVIMHNVLGILEGRESSSGMVVVGAHLDHDGVDEAGRIYNGADDNASGTAAVLAIAAAFARAAARGERPARAVVFALWNGEEKGSLGAEYYAAAPVPARRVVANLNLDMVGREEDIPDPDDSRFQGFAKTSAAQNTNVVHLLGYSYSPDLAAIVERANDTVRLTIKEDYDRDSQGLLHRSDNWPFLEHGIPAVFLTTGLHPEYHTPDDDTERIDFAKLERIAELACRAAWMAADGDAPRLKTK
jgi:Peptidase family M28/PA domain